jgi:hypothetical protein
MGRADAARTGRWITAIAAVLTVCAVAFHLQARASWLSAQRQLAAVMAQAPASAPTAPAQDFVQRLGPPITAEALAAQLADLSATGVSLSGFTATPHEATTSTLGRIEVQLSLHGTYPNIKAALAQLLDRNPNAVLAHLTLRRAASDVDAQITLWLLSRPLPDRG